MTDLPGLAIADHYFYTKPARLWVEDLFGPESGNAIADLFPFGAQPSYARANCAKGMPGQGIGYWRRCREPFTYTAGQWL